MDAIKRGGGIPGRKKFNYEGPRKYDFTLSPYNAQISLVVEDARECCFGKRMFGNYREMGFNCGTRSLREGLGSGTLMK